MGMFSSPNSASIMNSVPPQERGVASGMMMTLMNTAFTASMAMFFTRVIVGITQKFPGAMTSSLASIGAAISPNPNKYSSNRGTVFGVLLNPANTILSGLPASFVAAILTQHSQRSQVQHGSLPHLQMHLCLH